MSGKIDKTKARRSLRGAIAFALAYQIPLILVIALTTNRHANGMAVLALIVCLLFWAFVGVLAWRRRLNFTENDLSFIRVGCLPFAIVLLIVAALLVYFYSILIWEL